MAGRPDIQRLLSARHDNGCDHAVIRPISAAAVTVTPMPVDAVVRGHGFRLALHVERYERPQDTTGSDANWLVAAVELDLGNTGAFTAKHGVSLFTPDLERFRDALRALDRDLSGEATLHHIESQLELTIKLNKGSGSLRGFVREHIGATLSFDQIATDPTYVREALEQFDELMTVFPVRGNPAD